VIIELRTLDITHGFAIDEFNIQTYIPPGETVTASFIADKPGSFRYYCNVFCGIGHPHMQGIFQVLP
jgi:heme/copper-type cytochrome/quinol oxidase subunit 2